MKRVRNGHLVPLIAGTPLEPPGATGVFETLRLQNAQPRFFTDHYRRFQAGCAYFTTASPSANILLAAARDLTVTNVISNGVLRWSAWRDPDGAVGWQATVEPPRPHMSKPTWRAVSTAAPLPSADASRAHKHLARQPWRDALNGARAAGFDETLLWDAQGRVVEGAISSFFCVSDGVIRTPALQYGPLPGIARGHILSLGGALGLPVFEAVVTRAELEAATECFFTNSLIGLRPIADLDGCVFPAPGPVTARLQEAWRERHGQL